MESSGIFSLMTMGFSWADEIKWIVTKKYKRVKMFFI
jgi:hypothetical protein